MRHIFLYTIIPFVLFAPFLWAGEGGVTLITSDRYGVEAEFIMPAYTSGAVQGPDGTYFRRIQVQGWARTSEKGLPELPVTGTAVEVPVQGEIRLEILESGYETVPDMRIYPVPEQQLTEEGIIAEFCLDESAYRTDAFFPSPIAEIVSHSVQRDMHLAIIRIYPFRWNPATGELRCYTKIRFRIGFEFPLSSDLTRSSDAPGLRDVFEWPGSSPDSMQKPEMLGREKTASADVIKISIKSNAVCRFTYSDLIDTGAYAAGIDPRTFQLFHKTTEIPLTVISALPDAFAAGDYIEFYGEGIDTDYTGTNVYMLYRGDSSGRRISAESGAVSGTAKEISSFYDTVLREENDVMWAVTPGAPESDYWFWEKIDAPFTRNYTMTIPFPAPEQKNAVVRVTYQGRSTASPHPNHHTRVYLNGTLISSDGNAWWDGDSEYIQEIPLNENLFVNGSNIVKIEAPGDTGAVVDTVYLNRIGIACDRLLKAVNDELTFTISGNERLGMTVSGLTSDRIRVWDITEPGETKEITDMDIRQDGTAWQAAFEADVNGERKFYIFTDARITGPDTKEKIQISDLKTPDRGADYILITDPEFLEQTGPLLQFRQEQGLRVAGVSTAQIYNEFSYGLTDPAAIRDFLTYAYENWQKPAPLYVFLVGDANSDYRDYSGTGKQSRVPTHLIFTETVGLTPEDNWFVCVQGDDLLPDMLIGRASAASPQMVSDIVEKIIGYESSAYEPKKALFVSDNNDIAFENENELFSQWLPSDFQKETVYLSAYPNVSGATADIIARMNEGMLISSYTGHGSVTNWAGEFMFQSSDVEKLANGNSLCFVTMMTCINGYYSHPEKYSLAEEFMVAADKGAIAGFAPSGVGYVWEQEILGDELFSAIFGRGKNIVGTAVTHAKLYAYARGTGARTVSLYTLFGDPATRLKVDTGIIPGDLYDDGIIDLQDVILALQITVGILPPPLFFQKADVNGDGFIGLPEAIYDLGKLAEIR